MKWHTRTSASWMLRISTAALLVGSMIFNCCIAAAGIDISERNYLVIRNGNSDSSIRILPHRDNPSPSLVKMGIVEPMNEGTVAGQWNADMVQRARNKPHTIAILDWPKNREGKTMTIVARFDNDKFDIPACYQSVELLNDERLYYSSWSSMKIRESANGDYLIGVHASGGDGDGEGSGGWDLITLLKLTSACKLTILHKEYNDWLEDYEVTSCYGTHLDFRFIDDQSAEITMTGHTCSYPESKGKVTRKKIPLSKHN